MTANFHTHTNFCDGKNSVEEIAAAAVEKGFSAIGFSGHGYTAFDVRYCMMDTAGYLTEVKRVKEKYKDRIQVYTGIEEDAFDPVQRAEVDYIIGSSHYIYVDGAYYPIDSGQEYFRKCLEAFGGDTIKLAEAYYRNFCSYIKNRQPDIIGHFDLITKFDEPDLVFLKDPQYTAVAEKYLKEALKADCIFEVNTGAVSRGYRTSPYPYENLLYLIRRNGGKVMVSSDSHCVDTLDFQFEETKIMLKSIGFQYIYTLWNGEFVKEYL